MPSRARLSGARQRWSTCTLSAAESSYLTLSQVAVRTGRHPELLRQWCAAGRVPCARVGASWVMLARDVPLLDGIASRRGRGRQVSPIHPTGTERVIAAVFDDPAAAAAVAEALRDRLDLPPEAVGTSTMELPPIAALTLTVLAARVPAESVVGARRIVAAFGGRIVADIEEIRAQASGEAAVAIPADQGPELGDPTATLGRQSVD